MFITCLSLKVSRLKPVVFKRKRAIGLSILISCVMIAAIGFIPFYHSIRAAGVMKSDGASSLYSPLDGLLREVYVVNGQSVVAGDLIAKIENRDLALDIEKYEKQLEEVQALSVQAIQGEISNLKPLQKQRESLKWKIYVLRLKQNSSIIRAEHAGVFISDDLKVRINTWIEERQLLGQIIDEENFSFIAVVTQDQAYDLFHSEQLKGEIRLPGKAGITIKTTELKVIPYEQNRLPAASLGWRAGGEIPTQDDDSSGTKTKESFFQVTAKMQRPKDLDVSLFYHDKRGQIRIDLSFEPLGRQLYKKYKQLLQKRYYL